MVGEWMSWILVQSILLLALDWQGLAQGPDCWDTCFLPEQRMDSATGSDQYKDEYRDVSSFEPYL